MKKIMVLFLISIVLFSCNQSDDTDEAFVDDNSGIIQEVKPDMSTLKEGNGFVYGTAGLLQGNCMPSPDEEYQPCSPGGLKATVYITFPSSVYKSDLLIASAETNDEGYYELQLEPGNYSMFIYDNFYDWKEWVECGDSITCDENGAYNCDGWSGESDSEIVCSPFTIINREITQVNPIIDHAAW